MIAVYGDLKRPITIGEIQQRYVRFECRGMQLVSGGE